MSSIRSALMELAAEVARAGLDPSPIYDLALNATQGVNEDEVLGVIATKPALWNDQTLRDFVYRLRRVLTNKSKG